MRERKICAFALMSFLSLSALSAGAPSHVPEADKLDRQVQELYKAGKYSDAIPIERRVLELREKALGSEHPETATSLNNLGELYERMGDYTKAELLLQRALKIREKVLGPEHPETLKSRNYLAQLHRKMGDHATLSQRAPPIKPQSTQNTE